MNEDRAIIISLVIFVVSLVVLLMYVDNLTIPVSISLALALLFYKSNTKER